MSRIHDLLTAAHGRCRLVFSSAASITLQRYQGSILSIGGLPRQIPAAGVSASNTGLAASTIYYVYALWSGSAITLELSTTGHAANADTGVEVKSGDTSRTLVGMVRTNASSQFEDASAARGVLSYFNRREIAGLTATLTNTTSSTASLAELGVAVDRVQFLAWPDELTEVMIVGSATNTTAGNIQHSTSAGVDAAALGAQSTATTFTNGVPVAVSARYMAALSEGSHTASAFGKVSAGTGSWNYGVQVTLRG